MHAVDPAMFVTFERETLGVLDPMLRSWALQVMLSGLPYEARQAHRDRALRAAAGFLPADLSLTERARQLHAALSAARRRTRPAHPDLNSLEGCLAYALLARDTVPKWRQLFNVLEGMQFPCM
ncbi:hypothetical protein [Myxococcus sp. Y35]|uniref:hypothetical protein n=1 Tax=Pseudomyxococcus flavus TaxID=3115648 RepID=UPI003CE8E977